MQTAPCRRHSAARTARAGAVPNTLVLGSAALLAELAAPETDAAAVPNDRDILNFALVLEYLQASFYTEAERRRLPREAGTSSLPARCRRARARYRVPATRSARRRSSALLRLRRNDGAVEDRSSRRPWRSRTWRSPRTRARRATSARPDTSLRRSRSTASKRGTPPGSGTCSGDAGGRTRSTSRSRQPRPTARRVDALHRLEGKDDGQQAAEVHRLSGRLVAAVVVAVVATRRPLVCTSAACCPSSSPSTR